MCSSGTYRGVRAKGRAGAAFLLSAAAFLSAGDFVRPAAANLSGGGGESRLDPESGSIPPEERERAGEAIASFVEQFGPLSVSTPGEEVAPLRFFPIGGRLWRDLLTLNYVDLDPGAGVLDWDCTGFTEDGHAGNDTLIRTFAEQQIGVAVFAADDGTVVAVHDGEPDQNTVESNLPSNFVIIDHGSGREVWYWHLKRDSVLVSVGESVVAGQQIAKVGSSGNSEGPHLHLEVHLDGVVVEPYAGPCNPGVGLWRDQVPIRRDTYLQDFGLTTRDLSVEAGWPARWPATGHVALADPLIRVWFLGANLPPASTWRVQFRRPNGSLVDFALTQDFGNSVAWRRFHWWWTYDVVEMHTTPGTWHVLLFINDELMVEAPVEVLAESDPQFNRPPYSVEVRFDPPEPLVGDVVGCVVDSSLTLDDPDYDVVRYEYTWVVNEDIVRLVTTAGQADYLSTSAFSEGDLLICVVRPMDGIQYADSTATAIPAKRPAVPAASGWALGTMGLLVVTAATLILGRRRTIAVQMAAPGVTV